LIDGVVDTQSFLVLQVRKMSFDWGVEEIEATSSHRDHERVGTPGAQ
jgi:hypothetical protein